MRKIGEILDEIATVAKGKQEKVAFIPNPAFAGQAGAGGPSELQQMPPGAQQPQAGAEAGPSEEELMAAEQAQGAGGEAQQLTDDDKLHVSKVQSSGPPTDLDNSTVTLRLRDLLDLHSGGKATQVALKVQEHHQKMEQRQMQMQQKQQQDEAKRQQQQAVEAQMAQQGGMMNQGGIY